MNHSPNDRQSPLAPFPDQPTPRPCARGVQVLRTWHRCFLITATSKHFMQVSLNKS